jgi:hypothetical protein
VTVGDAGNESETRFWTVNGVDAGNVSVLSADDVGSGVVDAYTEPVSVAPNGSYDVVAVVHNPNDVSTSYVVSFTSDGDAAGTFRYVQVAAGETVMVTRSVEAPSTTGSVEWHVSGQNTTVEITSDA